ncbi:hypothetical protein KDW_36820 [Dictyobacter vulcani]|uniref:Uncharacterized protein n=1 Tax=Dictyobacter vulcani TaxID=2607529 RepID=A0A5J4KST9_9CHLR|nr:hypothetical protein KDW_36820 [Dictyobacter vulcani]
MITHLKEHVKLFCRIYYFRRKTEKTWKKHGKNAEIFRNTQNHNMGFLSALKNMVLAKPLEKSTEVSGKP